MTTSTDATGDVGVKENGGTNDKTKDIMPTGKEFTKGLFIFGLSIIGISLAIFYAIGKFGIGLMISVTLLVSGVYYTIISIVYLLLLMNGKPESRAWEKFMVYMIIPIFGTSSFCFGIAPFIDTGSTSFGLGLIIEGTILMSFFVVLVLINKLSLESSQRTKTVLYILFLFTFLLSMFFPMMFGALVPALVPLP